MLIAVYEKKIYRAIYYNLGTLSLPIMSRCVTDVVADIVPSRREAAWAGAQIVGSSEAGGVVARVVKSVARGRRSVTRRRVL